MQVPSNDDLTLSPTARDSLERASSFHTAFSKMNVYFEHTIPVEEAKRACLSAHAHLENEHDMELMPWLSPVVLEERVQTLQNVLTNHFERLQEYLDTRSTEASTDFEMYPYGFIYLRTADLDNEQAIMVHCDEVKKVWQVGRCAASFRTLSYHASDLVMAEEFFPNVRFAVSGREFWDTDEDGPGDDTSDEGGTNN